MKYDEVVSLGYNCEVSFRIEQYFGKINAMPFSWTFELDRELFVAALDNIEDLFTGEVELYEDQMILDKKYRIKFHPRYEVLRKYGTPTEETYNECVEELRGRTAHLKSKFAKLMSGDKSTLFIMKVQDLGEDDNIAYINKVMQVLLKRYASGKFTLAAVFEKNALTEKTVGLETEYAGGQLKIRGIKKFAPKKHTDIMGDIRGWKKVIRELTGEPDSGYGGWLARRRLQWFSSAVKRRFAKLKHMSQ